MGGAEAAHTELAELEIEAPTDSQQWLMLGGLLISIIWTMRLIYYHAEPHIWHDAQVGMRQQPSHLPRTPNGAPRA